MKPQLSFPLRRLFVSIFLLLASLALPFRAAAAPCSSSNIDPGPGHPVAFVVAATSPGAVSEIDLTNNAIVCSIAVGNSPSHLAFSPDSSLLLVENDADATVSVIKLVDGSTSATLNLNTLVTPGTSGVTGNIAATFDGTNLFAYVAVYPNPLPVTPAPVLGRINLGTVTSGSIVLSSPPTLTSIGSVTVNGATPANGDVGVAFTPDGSKAYITFDGNTDLYLTATDAFSASHTVTGGSFTVSPVGDLGWLVQTAAGSSSAAPNRVTISSDTFVAAGAAAGQNVCSQSNTVATSLDGTVAYYTCPANNSFQLIDTSTTSATANQVTNTVNLGTAGSTPNGIAATTDGASLLVANGNTTISVFTSATPITPTTTPTETNFAGPGGALISIGQRPPVLSGLAPSNPSVATGTTQQFSAALAFAVNASSLKWAVSCTPGGLACGAIDSTGKYTAPTAIPTGGTVTVSATSPQLPSGSKLYPLKTTVTITPSQLAFTTAVQTLTAGVCSAAIAVQSQDSLGNPANSTSTETLALVSSSGGTFYSNNTCATVITSTSIPTSANSATFFYKDNKPGSPVITVNGSGSFTATVTQTETVNAGPANSLVFTSSPLTVTAGACSTAVSIQSQDSLGNASNPSGTETLALSSNSSAGTFYSNNTCTTAITATSIPTSASSATFFYKDTKSGSPTITVAGSGAFASTPTQIETVNAATASALAFTNSPVSVTANVCSTAITVQSRDSLGNPSNPGAVENLGLATSSATGTFFSNNTCTTAITSSTISSSANSVAFFYKDKKAASPTITVTGSGAFSATVTQSETVTSGQASALSFTTSAQTLTAGVCSAAITIQSQDSSGNPSSPTSTETLALATNSTAGTFYSDNACTATITSASIPTSASSATFFYKDTKAASPTITVAGSGAFSSTVTQNETVNAAPASTLVFTTSAQTLTAGVCSAAVTLQSQDNFGNPSNPASAETLGLATSSTAGTFYSDNICTTVITGASIPTSANSASFFYKDTKAASPTITVAGSGAFSSTVTQNETVNPGPPSQLAFTTTAQGQTTTLQPVSSGTLGGNTTPVPSVFVAVQDAFGNLVNTSTASITITSSPANVSGTIPRSAVSGVATFSNLQFTVAGTYTLTAVSGSLTTAPSNPFTLTSNITVAITSAITTVKIEDLPSGTDTFMAAANGDPNIPSLNVTWAIVSCGGSNTNLSLCGTVASSGAYTPPQKVPVANGFVVQATANADPTKMTASGAITIGSSVTVSVSIVQGSILPPATNTVAVGFPVSLQAAVGNDPNNLGVMNWSVNGIPGGNSTVGTVVATDSTHATYTAPAVVPSPATINITASSVADFNKVSPPGSLQIVADQLVFDTTNPTANQINIPTSSSSGSVTIDLQGTAGASLSSFACTDLDTLNGKSATCAFAATSGSASACPPTAQCTSVNLTLSVVRGAVILPVPESYNPWTGFNRILGFSLLLILALFSFAMFLRPQLSGARIKHAFAFALLLCLSLGWLAACGQFVQPATPTPPVPPITQAVTGNLTVTATIGSNQVTIKVPFTVN